MIDSSISDGMLSRLRHIRSALLAGSGQVVTPGWEEQDISADPVTPRWREQDLSDQPAPAHRIATAALS